MPELAQAKLYTVSEPLDRPVTELVEGETAVEIQFNPASLAVAMANTLGENERDDSDKPAQFVDKSSSTLTVELVFDTTDQYFTRDVKDANGNPTGVTEEARVDVRALTQAIAVNFMKQETVGDDTAAPKRCLFAWGTFAFVGVMETFDETLEFFSPEGTPLRATVSLKISESRFQFRTEEAKAAERDTPTLGAGGSDVAETNTDSGKDDKDWRETAMYNGVEEPRAPSADALSVPSAGASADLKASASLNASAGIKGGFGGSIGGGAGLSAGIGGGLGISGGLSAGVSGGISAGVSGGLSAGIGGGISGGFDAGISGGIGGGLSAGISGGLDVGISGGIGGGLSSSIDITPPSFSFGSSASLGTSIPGAFSADFKSGGGISAGSLVSGGMSLNGSALSVSTSSSSGGFSSSASASSSFNSGGGSATATASANASIGFD